MNDLRSRKKVLGMINRLTGIALAVVMTVLPMSGCGMKSDNVTLTLNIATNKDMQPFLDELQNDFPDVDFDIYCYNGENSTGFINETFKHEDTSDIVFHTQKVTDDLARENLLDLSGYDFIGNIDYSMLNQFDSNGKIYQIPGPVSLRSMAYNKTVFEEHGWDIPENFEELLSLVSHIAEEDADMIPILMSLGGTGYPFTAMTTFSQAGFLSTPSGDEWEKRYLSGNASVSEGWADGLDMLGQLIDAGAFRGAEECVGKWDDAVIDEYFSNGKAALMFVWGKQSYLNDVMDSSEYEFGFLPFYGPDNGNELFGMLINTTWGLNKKLAEKGNEKKLEKALEVMEWLSSDKAQGLLSESEAEIPSIKKFDTSGMSERYIELWDRAADADKALMIYSGYEDVIVDVGEILQEHIVSGSSEGMAEEVVGIADSVHKASLSETDESSSIGVLTDDLDRAQSVQLVADAIESVGLADVALVSEGGSRGGIKNKYGVSGWLYSGAVDSNYIIIIPDNGTHIIEVLELSGSRLRSLMEDGKRLADNDREAYAPYYWSGIDAELKNGKIKSSELEDEKVYKVAFINGDYSEELADECPTTDTGVDLHDIIEGYFRENSPVSAPKPCR